MADLARGEPEPTGARSALRATCDPGDPRREKPTAKPDTRPDYAFPPCHKIELVMGTGEARCDSITVRPDVGGRDSCGTTAPRLAPTREPAILSDYVQPLPMRPQRAMFRWDDLCPVRATSPRG